MAVVATAGVAAATAVVVAAVAALRRLDGLAYLERAMCIQNTYLFRLKAPDYFKGYI